MKNKYISTLLLAVSLILSGQLFATAELDPSNEDSLVVDFSCADLSFYMSRSYTKGPDTSSYSRAQSTDANTLGEVSQLQSFLKDSQYMSQDVFTSGRFGPLTTSALKKFQQAYGISQTGATGPRTRAKIRDLSCDQETTPPVNTSIAAPTLSPVSIKTTEESGAFSYIYWTPVSDATGYKYRLNNGQSESIVKTDTGTILSGSLPFMNMTEGRVITWFGAMGAMLPAGNHTLSVQACNGTGCSSWSNPVAIAVTGSTPTSLAPPRVFPTSINAAQGSTAASTISWSSVAGATEYRYRLNNSQAMTIAGGSTARSWSGEIGYILPVGNHTFSIQACDGTRCSSWSNPVAIAVTGTGTTPTALASPRVFPTSINAIQGSAAASTISWSFVSDATEYKYRLNNGQSMAIAGGSGARSWSGEIGYILPVGNHTLSIQACNGTGCSLWSNPVAITVTVPPVPAVPAVPPVTQEVWVDFCTGVPSWEKRQVSTMTGATRSGGNAPCVINPIPAPAPTPTPAPAPTSVPNWIGTNVSMSQLSVGGAPVKVATNAGRLIAQSIQLIGVTTSYQVAPNGAWTTINTNTDLDKFSVTLSGSSIGEFINLYKVVELPTPYGIDAPIEYSISVKINSADGIYRAVEFKVIKSAGATWGAVPQAAVPLSAPTLSPTSIYTTQGSTVSSTISWSSVPGAAEYKYKLNNGQAMTIAGANTDCTLNNVP